MTTVAITAIAVNLVAVALMLTGAMRARRAGEPQAPFLMQGLGCAEVALGVALVAPTLIIAGAICTITAGVMLMSTVNKQRPISRSR